MVADLNISSLFTKFSSHGRYWSTSDTTALTFTISYWKHFLSSRASMKRPWVSWFCILLTTTPDVMTPYLKSCITHLNLIKMEMARPLKESQKKNKRLCLGASITWHVHLESFTHLWIGAKSSMALERLRTSNCQETSWRKVLTIDSSWHSSSSSTRVNHRTFSFHSPTCCPRHGRVVHSSWLS